MSISRPDHPCTDCVHPATVVLSNTFVVLKLYLVTEAQVFFAKSDNENLQMSHNIITPESPCRDGRCTSFRFEIDTIWRESKREVWIAGPGAAGKCFRYFPPYIAPNRVDLNAGGTTASVGAKSCREVSVLHFCFRFSSSDMSERLELQLQGRASIFSRKTMSW